MTNRKAKYIRVSSIEQNSVRQIEKTNGFKLYEDKTSKLTGKPFVTVKSVNQRTNRAV
jgi:hypothetical protein